ncbi:MAG TPA: glycosyltransferase family 39 protein, partial [Chloroflexota bacterium]|nr:glycosyltransferase family 39 protein [Chloroflexota bacterium]
MGVAALALAAFAIALPYLWSIPEFTDETLMNLRSFSIFEGRSFPLTNGPAYIGAFYNYLEAAAFWVFGPSVYTPRLLSGLIGAMTVPAAYLFARPIAGRPLAGLTAGLLATSGVEIAGVCHIGWNHSATPLLFILTLTLIVRAVKHRSGWSLAGAGALLGLALQTHVLVLPFLPGVAAYVLWKGRWLLRTRWIPIAAALCLLCYGNMIVYNVTTGFKSVEAAIEQNRSYAAQVEGDSGTYFGRQRRILLTLLRFPSSAIDRREGWADYVRDPIVMGYAALAVTGLVFLTRRGEPLPALVILSAVLTFPLFGARHDLLPRQGRYLAPLLTLIYLGVATGAWWIARNKCGPLLSRIGAPSERKVLGVLAAIVLTALPLATLHRFYDDAAAADRTNDRFFALLPVIQANRDAAEVVLLDYNLAQERLGGGGTALRSLDYLLSMNKIPYREVGFELPDRVLRRH